MGRRRRFYANIKGPPPIRIRRRFIYDSSLSHTNPDQDDDRLMMNERLYTPGEGWRKIKSLMNHKDGIGYIKTKEREGKGKERQRSPERR